MQNQNIVLTKKSMARHTKRLMKEMQSFNYSLKLNEAQNMLSRILGCKDFHELNKILDNNENNIVREKESDENKKELITIPIDDSIFSFLEEADNVKTGLFHVSPETFLIKCVKILNDHFSKMEVSFFKEYYVYNNFIEINFFNNNNDLEKSYKIKIITPSFQSNELIENLKNYKRDFSKFQVSYSKDNIRHYIDGKEVLTYIFKNNRIVDFNKYKKFNEIDMNLSEVNYVISYSKEKSRQGLFSIAKEYMKRYKPKTGLIEDYKYDLIKENNEGIIYKIEDDINLSMYPLKNESDLLYNVMINVMMLKSRTVDFFVNLNLNFEKESLYSNNGKFINLLEKAPNEYLDIIIYLLNSSHLKYINNLYFLEKINHDEYLFCFNMKDFVKLLKKENILNNGEVLKLEIDFEIIVKKYINNSLNNNFDKEVNNRFIDRFNK